MITASQPIIGEKPRVRPRPIDVLAPLPIILERDPDDAPPTTPPSSSARKRAKPSSSSSRTHRALQTQKRSSNGHATQHDGNRNNDDDDDNDDDGDDDDDGGGAAVVEEEEPDAQAPVRVERVLVPRFSIAHDVDGVAKHVKSWKRPSVYVEFKGRSLDDLVEYELDEDDEEFLHALNTVLKISNSPRKSVLTEDDLEAVMNYFEIESFYQRDPASILSMNAPFSGLYNESNDAETPCAVCGDPDFNSSNLIVFCDGCDMAVHQACYFLRSIPAGSWLCRRCSLRDSMLGQAKCKVCTVKRGPLLPCAGGIGWAHVLCALYVNGVTIAPDVSVLALPTLAAADGEHEHELGDGAEHAHGSSNNHVGGSSKSRHRHARRVPPASTRVQAAALVPQWATTFAPFGATAFGSPGVATSVPLSAAALSDISLNPYHQSMLRCAELARSGAPAAVTELPLVTDGDVLHGLEALPSVYWGQRCALCRQSEGVCVRCSHATCATVCHVMCARVRGLCVDVVMSEHNTTQRLVYCRLHSMALQLARPPPQALSALDLRRLALGVLEHSNMLEINEPALAFVYYYWRQRRREHAQPLVARLRDGQARTTLCSLEPLEYRARFYRLRQAFEKSRILCDLVQKRELLKQQLVAHLAAVQTALETRAAAARAHRRPTPDKRRK